jgi:hypothetical protein
VHRREPPRASAPDQAKKKRLGLIVPRVPDRHAIRGELLPRAFEEFVTRAMSGILDRATFASRSGPHVFAFDHDRPAQAVGKSDAETLISIRSCPQLMVEMDQPGDTDFSRRNERPEYVRERDRIGAARKREDDACRTRSITCMVG